MTKLLPNLWNYFFSKTPPSAAMQASSLDLNLEQVALTYSLLMLFHSLSTAAFMALMLAW